MAPLAAIPAALAYGLLVPFPQTRNLHIPAKSTEGWVSNCTEYRRG